MWVHLTLSTSHERASLDPLEVLFVRQVMRRSVLTLQQGSNLQGLLQTVDQAGSTQRLFPVIDARGSLIGVLTRKDLRNIEGRAVTLAEVIRRHAVTAFPDEPLRVVVYRMAETGFTQMPVVERQDSRKVVGIVSLADLLQARARDLEQEHRRQRVLKLSLPFRSNSAESLRRFYLEAERGNLLGGGS